MKFVPNLTSKMTVVAATIFSLSTAVDAFLLSPPSPTVISPILMMKPNNAVTNQKYKFSSAMYAAASRLSGEDPTAKSGSNNKSYQKVFDFTDSALNTIDKFDRIDDVIMGGISTSTLRQQDNESFSRWSGICREDGG